MKIVTIGTWQCRLHIPTYLSYMVLFTKKFKIEKPQGFELSDCTDSCHYVRQHWRSYFLSTTGEFIAHFDLDLLAENQLERWNTYSARDFRHTNHVNFFIPQIVEVFDSKIQIPTNASFILRKMIHWHRRGWIFVFFFFSFLSIGHF